MSDKDLLPVYVGQAGSGRHTLFDRLKSHEKDHLWNRWAHFSWFGFRGVNRNGSLSQHDHVAKSFKVTGPQLLNEIEGVLITVLEPRLNKQGASWKDAEQYFQSVDDDVLELTTADLHDSIADLKAEIQVVKKLLTKRV